jgi:hypothetical protein
MEVVLRVKNVLGSQHGTIASSVADELARMDCFLTRFVLRL